MLTDTSVQVIQKEFIGQLHFPKEDVLYTQQDKLSRTANLRKAMKLGNVEHLKVVITFQDIEGTKKVDTTIWGVTDQEVILKQGRIIPIHRIIDVVII